MVNGKCWDGTQIPRSTACLITFRCNAVHITLILRQKDERALPGNLQNRKYSFFLSPTQWSVPLSLSLSPHALNEAGPQQTERSILTLQQYCSRFRKSACVTTLTMLTAAGPQLRTRWPRWLPPRHRTTADSSYGLRRSQQVSQAAWEITVFLLAGLFHVTHAILICFVFAGLISNQKRYKRLVRTS
jgi:hypothetical protein